LNFNGLHDVISQKILLFKRIHTRAEKNRLIAFLKQENVATESKTTPRSCSAHRLEPVRSVGPATTYLRNVGIISQNHNIRTESTSILNNRDQQVYSCLQVAYCNLRYLEEWEWTG
jgi:hypothetical protein